MLQEDGVENAVHSFYHHLPISKMLCAMTSEHLATKWLTRDHVQVCDGCAIVLREHTDQAIADYHVMEYGLVGPSSGLSGLSQGVGVLMHEVLGAVADVVAEPTKGFLHGGLKGGAIGVAKGLGGTGAAAAPRHRALCRPRCGWPIQFLPPT